MFFNAKRCTSFGLLAVFVVMGVIATQPVATQAQDLEERLRMHRSFVWVKRWVTPDEGERIRRLDLEGVDLAVERRRLYPNGDLAASCLGFAGRDEVGLSGLEFAFDGALRGAPSTVPALRDVRGRKLAAWDGDPEAPPRLDRRHHRRYRSRGGRRFGRAADVRHRIIGDNNFQRPPGDAGSRTGVPPGRLA